METILKRITEEPADITYLGIGSAPHLSEGEVLQPKYDQLLPSCFHDQILISKKTMRIIHFDPFFDDCKPFLDKYWKEWSTVPIEMEGGYHWINDILDIVILPRRIEHQDQYWFFEQLVGTVLNTKGSLVIQEYTGYGLTDLNKKLFESCELKEKYKRRVLLDLTFGTDIGCTTDMLQAQPFYDYDGNFLNLHFLTDEQVKRWVGISLKLDELLRKKYIGQYMQTLNSMHVDYRRKLKGEVNMYGSDSYTNDSTPDEIMTVLQKTLQSKFEILQLLRVIENQKQISLQELFKDYKKHDPYKWYDAVSKLVRP